MALFESKEKKLKRQQEEEEARANAEYEAKYAAKTERKKAEKIIVEIDKSLQGLMSKAAAAKSKGYEDVYRQCLGMIKIAKGRKAQAEKFLFQMDAMQEIQNISKSSTELLGSMSTIMGSLGKLSLDRSVLLNTQKTFGQAQRELDVQSNTIEGFIEGMTMNMPEDDILSGGMSDSDIEADIDAMILGGQISSAKVSAQGGSDDMADLRKLLET
jgi:hypothetical protein